MINQKQAYVPKVLNTDVTLYDATTSFTTDFIEFPYTEKDWSLNFTFSGVVTSGTYSILVCNTQDGTYRPYKAAAKDVDLTSTDNHVIFDDIMPFRYMKIQYVATSITGLVSINMSK